MGRRDDVVVHHVYGCAEIEPASKRSAASVLDGIDQWVFAVQGEWGVGGAGKDFGLVSFDL